MRKIAELSMDEKAVVNSFLSDMTGLKFDVGILYKDTCLTAEIKGDKGYAHRDLLSIFVKAERIKLVTEEYASRDNPVETSCTKFFVLECDEGFIKMCTGIQKKRQEPIDKKAAEKKGAAAPAFIPATLGRVQTQVLRY